MEPRAVHRKAILAIRCLRKILKELRFLCFLLFNSCARSSKRTVRLISGIALDECLAPERYRTRAPFFTSELIARVQQFAKPDCCLLPVEAPCGYRQNKLLPFWSVGPGLNSVQSKKYDARAECRPLVAINEGVIPAKVIQIRCCEFGQIPIRRLASKTCLGGCDGRFQQSSISDTIRAAKSPNGLSVNFSHNFHSQVEAPLGRNTQASFFIVRP